jgi:cell division protein FtsB
MRLRRAVWPVLVLVVLIGVLFVAVFPTRTWWAQRADMTGATEQLQILDEQNHLLEQRVSALQSDDEIERLAREQYNLVKPGEEAYALLPAPTSSGPPATIAPIPEEREKKRSLPGKVWHFLTGWM